MKKILIIILGLGLLVGLFFVLKPTTDNQSSAQKVFQLEIKDTTIVAGSSTLNVKQGDSVTIKILSDVEEEFHLHGYDRSTDLVPNQESQLSFVADISGRFAFELEKSKKELGVLEVQPK
jgi:hypothetical protein